MPRLCIRPMLMPPPQLSGKLSGPVAAHAPGERQVGAVHLCLQHRAQFRLSLPRQTPAQIDAGLQGGSGGAVEIGGVLWGHDEHPAAVGAGMAGCAVRAKALGVGKRLLLRGPVRSCPARGAAAPARCGQQHGPDQNCGQSSPPRRQRQPPATPDTGRIHRYASLARWACGPGTVRPGRRGASVSCMPATMRHQCPGVVRWLSQARHKARRGSSGGAGTGHRPACAWPCHQPRRLDQRSRPRYRPAGTACGTISLTGRSPFRGRPTVNTAPPPGWLPASMCPPCSRAFS